jgi:hypothetical protein
VRRVYLGHSFDDPVAGISAAEERELFEDRPPPEAPQEPDEETED